MTPELTGFAADTAYAVLDGLRTALCESVNPMPLDNAREILRAAVPGAS